MEAVRELLAVPNARVLITATTARTAERIAKKFMLRYKWSDSYANGSSLVVARVKDMDDCYRLAGCEFTNILYEYVTYHESILMFLASRLRSTKFEGEMSLEAYFIEDMLMEEY